MVKKSQRRSKNTLALKLLINLILILTVSFGLYFLLQGRLPITINRETEKVSTDFITNLKELKYLNLEAKEFCSPDTYAKRLEIVTVNNWRIILDTERDLKEQLGLVQKALEQGLEIKEYIGIDARGLLYYK